MHIHILGICGTFMGGLAVLAKQLGHHVTGSDQHVYPPMSTQLEAQGIILQSGYSPAHLSPSPDLVVVGNALSRGNPEVEAVLDQNLPYISGPEWLYRFVLKDHWVLAIAGTHGKTTTASLLSWILDYAGLRPGFLVGGVPINFGISARMGEGRYFVIEADEYDTAFFDKRSKFVHYRPRTAILNNLEFDHADIFPDITAIQRQFHHLVRCIASNGLIIAPEKDTALSEVRDMGCWTPIEYIGAQQEEKKSTWSYRLLVEDGSQFVVFHKRRKVGTVQWEWIGMHNVCNAIAAIAAAHHTGISPEEAIAALPHFRHVKRRLEIRAKINGITLYDDFAHHPTAIATTLEGLRARVQNERIIAVLEPRSNTLRMGVQAEQLPNALRSADCVLMYQPPDIPWAITDVVKEHKTIEVFCSIDAIVERIQGISRSGDHILFMSNGSFSSIHEKTEQALLGRKIANL